MIGGRTHRDPYDWTQPCSVAAKPPSCSPKYRTDEAEGWWRRGAEAGDPWCYNKIGVVRLQAGDLSEAERWFRRAAQVGDPAAMFNLGSVALARDAEGDAVGWFRRAHGAGHPEAANVLRGLAGS